MNILFVLNHARDLEAKQTSTLLALACLHAGHNVWLTGIRDVSTDDSRLCGQGLLLSAAHPDAMTLCAEVADTPLSHWTKPDLVVIRTNPARGEISAIEHRGQLAGLTRANARYLNAPDALLDGMGKANLRWLDQSDMPPTWFEPEPEEAIAAFKSLSLGAVVKPLYGTRGEGVVFIPLGDRDALKRALVTTPQAVLQAYLPDAKNGDLRVVVFKGSILECEGLPAAIRRRPKPGEFRSNLHQGGTAERAALSPAVRERAERCARMLHARGIALAGIDFVGDLIIELNIFATGGLKPARDLYGKDFCAEIVRRL